ncbi:MAG: peptidase M1 [Bacteroidetes bacterium HGW-Bacteroidetes-6]|jgi:hypothetical protein|nr:MAG: peptidase M1 [Bacteroidetes bacterium HGW-Bacteroidetes-6]
MKTVLFSLFAALCLSLSAQIDINETQQIARDDAFRASKITKTPMFVGQEYDLKYHRFNWIVDPAEDSIRGSVTSYFVVLQNNLSQIDFSLQDNILVDSVVYHGTKIVSIHALDKIMSTLPSPLASGILDSITVVYHGKPNPSGFGSFITDVHGGSNTPILWTLSEPYGAYEWWPCKNDLSDKIDSIDVYVTHPNGYHAASNGLLISETTAGPNTTAHWKHRYPIAAYLVAIAVTDYSIYTNNFNLSLGTLPVLNYVFPEDLSIAQFSTPTLESVMQFYDSIIAPYPFMNEKYGHAQFGWGGGMEHQTMSFMGSFGYELMAHELLHMWFGDAVTCGTWHDIWLNEGFATYFTALNYERYFPDQYWMPWKTSAVNYITSQPDGSVYVYDTTSVDRVFSSRLSYYKGAYVLHMLRWVMGDSAFFQGIRNYYNDPQFSYSYAKTPDLINHLEVASGLDLTEFFDDWFYGEGYPSYQTQVSYLPGDTISVVINQTQSHSSVSFFEMPVPITFWQNGFDTTIIFDHTYSGEEFRFKYTGYPDSVRFDPALWIVSANNSLLLSLSEKQSPKVSVYPNPVSNQLVISAGSDASVGILSVFDYRGALVLNSSYKSGEAVNVSILSPGLYQIVVETNNWRFDGSFVKE